MTQNKFIGRGWSFPPAFDRGIDGVRMLEGTDDISSSLSILLTTRLGERIMQHRFGCQLDEMMFDSLSTTLQTYITEMVRSAILYNEPRIELEEVRFDESRIVEGVVLIEVYYRIRSTNTRSNFVFPFYKKEGTDL